MSKLPELTFEEFCAKPMQLVIHLNGQKENYLHRHCAEVQVSTITITKKNKWGHFAKSKTMYIFSLTGDDYETADQVYLAYMEKACGITP